MKTAFLALAALGSVTALSLDGIPECAAPCLQEAIPKVGCGLDDTACQCSASTQEKLVSVVSPCLLKQCSSKELAQAQEAAGAQCIMYSASAAASTAAASTAAGKVTGTEKIVSTTTTPTFYASTPLATIGNATVTTPGSSKETETAGSGSGSATGSSSSPAATGNAASVTVSAVGVMLAVFAAAFAL